MDEIVPKKKEEIMKPSLAFDVATEIRRGYDLVLDIIEKLDKDFSVEELKDDDGNVIGQRTHVHPQLLSWIKESRLYTQDMWKMGGGELEQEAEKLRLDLEAKIILKTVGKKRDEVIDALEEWKKDRSFKEE